jgi:hypothetical protein
MIAGGAAAGMFGSLLGLGGGILIVPLLTLVFGLELREAVDDLALDSKIQRVAPFGPIDREDADATASFAAHQRRVGWLTHGSLLRIS